MTHSGLWKAIDKLARRQGKSCSALAKECGLDATTFNPSKRHDKYGKERWLSGRTLSKVLKRYDMNPADFFRLGKPEP